MASPTARSSCSQRPRRPGPGQTSRAVSSSLLQHRTDLREVEVLIAGLVALVHHAHVALAVDEYRGRHAGNFIELAHLAVDVERDRESHRLRQLVEPALGVTGRR